MIDFAVADQSSPSGVGIDREASGILNPVWAVEKSTLRAGKADGAVVFHRLDEGFQEAGRHFGIVVEQKEVVPVRHTQSRVVSAGKAGIGRSGDDVDIRVPVSDHRRLPGCRAVVYHDDLDIRIAETGQGVEQRTRDRGLIVVDRDDGNERGHGASPVGWGCLLMPR